MSPANAAIANRLAGPQKAAILILGLEEDVATEVLRHLDDDELRRLAEYTDHMEHVPIEALDPVFEDFERRMKDPIVPHSGGAYVRKLANNAVGEERARKLFAPPEGPRPPLETIRAAHTQTLAELLVDEQPQVAAVILSQLPREQAGKVMMSMPRDRQSDLLARIGELSEIPAQAVDMASESVARALLTAGGIGDSQDRKTFDGITFAASMLNELAPAETERLLGQLQEEHDTLAPRIREAMFTFEDLGRLSTRSLQVLMREIASDALLIALKTASETLREHFLSAVSSRAGAAMREDLANLPPTRLADVEAAQREVVEAAIRLTSEGRLTIPGTAEKMV